MAGFAPSAANANTTTSNTVRRMVTPSLSSPLRRSRVRELSARRLANRRAGPTRPARVDRRRIRLVVALGKERNERVTRSIAVGVRVDQTDVITQEQSSSIG